jgi:pimeloyl-ACP methyl ester carboxylesterase
MSSFAKKSSTDLQPLPDSNRLFFRTGKSRDEEPRLLNYVLRDGQEPAIVFCHGAGGNKHQWRRQWAALSASGHRMLAWDAIGHGDSARPQIASAYDGRRIAEDVIEIFRRFAGERSIVVAHSYGCRLVLALLHSLAVAGDLGKVAGAILVAPAPVEGAMSLGPLMRLPAFVLEWIRPLLATRFRRLAWHPSTDRALILSEEAAARRNSMLMVKALLGRAVRLDVACLAKLDLPITVLVGTEDGLTPPAIGARLVDLLPRARLVTVANCGHQIMLERPEAVEAAIADLLPAAASRVGA